MDLKNIIWPKSSKKQIAEGWLAKQNGYLITRHSLLSNLREKFSFYVEIRIPGEENMLITSKLGKFLRLNRFNFAVIYPGKEYLRSRSIAINACDLHKIRQSYEAENFGEQQLKETSLITALEAKRIMKDVKKYESKIS